MVPDLFPFRVRILFVGRSVGSDREFWKNGRFDRVAVWCVGSGCAEGIVYPTGAKHWRLLTNTVERSCAPAVSGSSSNLLYCRDISA